MRAMRTLLGFLGLERASRLMGWCWRTAAPFTQRHPRALQQIEASIPDMSGAAREQVIRGMWDGLGQTFAEGLLLDRLLQEPERITVADPALFADLCDPQKTPRGVVYVSLHAGNWETLGIPMVQNGLRVAGLYQAVQNPYLEADLLARRQALYSAGMITKGSRAMARIVRILKSGGAVAMLADQREARRGIAVPFFGKQAPSTPLPATLALRTGARLVLARCRRVGAVRYAIDLREIEVSPTQDLAGDVERLTGTIQAQLEKWIRERPSEWMWAHRRWSRDVRRPRHDVRRPHP
ncbi:MAG: lauroyl acyltransferase [Pseudomonadota bacterium]